MERGLRILLAGSWVLAGGWILPSLPEAGAADEGPRLVLGFPCEGVLGPPGDRWARDVLCYLHMPSDSGDQGGVEAWSLAVTASGAEITRVSVAGTVAASVDDDPPGHLAADGFERTRLLPSGPEGCDGTSGLVSVVILSRSGASSLPADTYHQLARFRVEGGFPGHGAASPARLAHADGCLDGELGAVSCEIVQRGETVSPALDACDFEFEGPRPCPRPEAPLQLILQTRSVGQTDELFAGMVSTPDPLLPGEVVFDSATGRLWAGIVSQLEEYGVEGWSVSLSARGDLRVLDAGVEGTVAASSEDGPPGLLGHGFVVTEVINPDRGYRGTSIPQGPGVVSAAVLSFTSRTALAPRGTATILGISLG